MTDDDAEIRREAIQILSGYGRKFASDELKNILVKPKRQSGFGALGALGSYGGLSNFSAPDKEGEAVWDRYNRIRIHALTSDQLDHSSAIERMFDPLYEIERYKRNFLKMGQKLREAIDGHFKIEFEHNLQEFKKNLNVTTSQVEQILDVSEQLRKGLTRCAMDLICQKGGPEDIERLRTSVNDDFVASTDADVKFLGKFGYWDDIFQIIELFKKSKRGGLTILNTIEHDVSYDIVAEAIYALGKNRFQELVALPMPPILMQQLIRTSSLKDFKALSDTDIMQLLRSENDSLRKMIALKCVRTFSKQRLTDLLEDYLSSDNSRYYNVIYWLDFGVSISRERGRAAAERLIAKS